MYNIYCTYYIYIYPHRKQNIIVNRRYIYNIYCTYYIYIYTHRRQYTIVNRRYSKYIYPYMQTETIVVFHQSNIHTLWLSSTLQYLDSITNTTRGAIETRGNCAEHILTMTDNRRFRNHTHTTFKWTQKRNLQTHQHQFGQYALGNSL